MFSTIDSLDAHADVLAAIKSCLTWFEPSGEYDHDVRDMRVLMLAYADETTKDITELGYVAKHSHGDYWWFTHHAQFACRYETVVKPVSLKTAKEELHEYAAREVFRLFQNSGRLLKLRVPMKKSDRKVCEAMSRKAEDTFVDGFKAGFQHAAKTQGFPRSPSWAKYLVQNNDGSHTWFENEPHPSVITCKWECDEGRSETFRLHEKWSGAIVRLR